MEIKEITENIRQYLANKEYIGSLQSEVEAAEEENKKTLQNLIQVSAEQGLTLDVLTIDDKKYRIGYNTKYLATGGEYKNPELRLELFNRLFEAGVPEADKITFKESVFVTESGEIFKAEDAGLPEKNFQKLVKGLSEEFRKKLVDDGLLSFYSYPVIEEVK